MLERFGIAFGDLDELAAAAPEVLPLVRALSADPEVLVLAHRIDDLVGGRTSPLVEVMAERAAAGDRTFYGAEVAGVAWDVATAVVIVRGGGVVWSGPADAITNGRARLLVASPATTVQRILRAELVAAVTEASTVRDVVDAFVAALANVCGGSSFAVGLWLPPDDAPVIDVRADDSRLGERLRSVVLARLERASGPVGGEGDRLAFGARGEIFPVVVDGHEVGTLVIAGDSNDPVALDLGDFDGFSSVAGAFKSRRDSDRAARSLVRSGSFNALVGGIAHDFNNSLQSIAGLTDLARLEAKDDRVIQHLDTLATASKDARSFVSRLLALSRTSNLDMRVLDLHQVLADAAQLVGRGRALDQPIGVELGARRSEVCCDESEMRSVFVNLILNSAAAASAERPLEISIRTSDLDRAGVGFFVVDVVDNGTGIAAADRERIFQPFVTTKGGSMGTGLGLAVAHSVVEGHGGTIAVHSTGPAGTTIRVELPLDTGTPSELSAANPRSTSLAGRRALVADDDPMVRDVLGAMLFSLDLEVETVATGQECIDAYTSDPSFDLVIVDELMPGLQGAEVIAALLAADPEVRTIRLSGYSELPVSDMATAQLVKPVTMSELAETIRAVLDG